MNDGLVGIIVIGVVLALAGWIGNLVHPVVTAVVDAWFQWPLALAPGLPVTPASARVVGALAFGVAIGAATYGARKLAALGLTGAAWAWACSFLVAAFLPIVVL